ncbi:MAG: hypothetical protein IPK77_14215 [Cellvibrio sp.]|nr:hypothetical protein [Cellvibrio sp.]
MVNRWIIFLCVGFFCSSAIAESIKPKTEKINRQEIVTQFSPTLNSIDKLSPFTLGNGKFAFTADVTGFQSFADDYFAAGFPLETKSRWAWHSKSGNYQLSAANEEYSAYGRQVNFPTKMDSPAAQWLRQNPHDLPLGRISLLLDGKKINPEKINNIKQHLDLWSGKLTSSYSLDGQAVSVESVVHAERDLMGFKIDSALNKNSRLAFEFHFPRGYDFSVKNTPDMDWQNNQEHKTKILKKSKASLVLERIVDDQVFTVLIRWQGKANIEQVAAHQFSIQPVNDTSSFQFTVEYLNQDSPKASAINVKKIAKSAKKYWNQYWSTGNFIDLTHSKNPQADELQRRIILSQYLLAAQSRSDIPAQETGLISSSWYGKFHTEMAWMHYAHWILWDRSDYALPMLNWYQNHLDVARNIAKNRGLEGARWPKMVGPDGRESPGGNPLIIWNQPHAIHLAEMLYEKTGNKKILKTYSVLVDETAQAMSSMLVWDEKNNRYILDSPIWISQEIYTPTESRNPTYELAYWRYGLETAQAWRVRQRLPINKKWQEQLNLLSTLPVKDGKYVAIESIPDTFDNPASREDHPSMLAPTAFFNDAYLDKKIMNNTLDTVLKYWRFDTKIWGWDYPMLAMASARLGRDDAVDLLLMKSKNNHYLFNGHCPQVGADLAVYLPANASLLTAVAVMLEKNAAGEFIGFPKNLGWDVKVEGF